MEIRYRTFSFHISFQDNVVFSIFPTFIFRSLIGMELKRLACLFPQKSCESCSIRFTCAYAVFFETHLDKETTPLEGRNRGSHPFILYSNADLGDRVTALTLDCTLVGNGILYLPFMYHALSHAGKRGIFKARIPFTVSDVRTGGKSIMEGEGDLKIDTEADTWALGQAADTDIPLKSMLIEFRTPYRLKQNGRFSDRFELSDLLQSLYRRAAILSLLHQDRKAGFPEPDPDLFAVKDLVVNDRKIRWTDLNYYSSRQSAGMRMGGVTGSIEVSGRFNPFQQSLFRFGELFHGGKNTGFGLGRIRCLELDRH